TPTGFQQSKRTREVPEGQLDGWPRSKSGVPGFPGRRLMRSFDALQNRPTAALALRGSVRLGILLEEVQRGRFFGSELGGFRNLLHGSGSGHFRQQLNTAVVLDARTGGGETDHYDVLLEAAALVHFAGIGLFR